MMSELQRYYDKTITERTYRSLWQGVSWGWRLSTGNPAMRLITVNIEQVMENVRTYHSFHHLVLLLTCTSPTSRWMLPRWAACGESPLVSSWMEILAVVEAEWDFSSTSNVSWEKEDLLAAFLDIFWASAQGWWNGAHGFTFILYRPKIKARWGYMGIPLLVAISVNDK